MRLIERISTLVLLSVTLNQLQAQKLAKGFSAPEGITSNGQRYFVSNIGPGSNKIGQDDDGFISEISPEGKIITLHFLPTDGKLSAPRGIDISGNVLYVADLDSIFGFDLGTRKTVFNLNLGPDTGLLNDLAVLNDSLIVVSDIFKNRIVEINTRTKQSKIIGEIGGPNGLFYDKKSGFLYACSVGDQNNGQGHIYRKELFKHDSDWEALKDGPTGFFDGIAFIGPNKIVVSDWISMESKKGKLIIYDKKKQNYETMNFGVTPADIFYDRKQKKLFVPQTNLDQISILTLKDLKSKKRKNQ